MSNQDIVVKNVIGSNFAITEDDGELLWENLKSAFKTIQDKDDIIILDFTGIELVTTAFLNKCIGINLFTTFSVDTVLKTLKIKGIQDTATLDLFKLVLDIAIKTASKSQQT